MTFIATERSWVAGGTINPSVFVTPLSGTDNTVVQSVSGDAPIGISGPGVKFAPIPQITSNPHAQVGDELRVFQDGETCPLTLGAGGCNAGDYLKPDGNGNGIVATHTSTDIYAAQAKQGGVAGSVVLVQVVRWRG